MINNKYIDPRFEETPLCDDEVVVLSTLGKGPKGDKGEKGDPITDEALYNAVAKYIEEHPGYVTTLMDGAVLERKLDPTLSLELCRCFDTVEQMQNATDLKAGMTCHTNGFHSAGDGGAAFYKVTEDGEPNGMDILALQGELFATLVITKSYVTPEQFGAYGDGIHDDTKALQAAVNRANIVILSKNYGSTGVYLRSNVSIHGSGEGIITMLSTHWCLYSTESFNISNVVIDGISFVGRNSYLGTYIDNTNLSRDVGICIIDGSNITVTRCSFTKFGEIAVRVIGTNVNISHNNMYSDADYSTGGAEPNYSFGISVDGSSINIENNTIVGYIHGIISGINFSDVIISNNYISQRVQHGMYIEGGNNVLISSNVIESDSSALCGIKIQNDQTGDVMHTFLITNNVIAAGDIGHGILVTGLTAYSSYISDVTIEGNKITHGNRGIEVSYVYKLTIADNDIDVTDASINTGIMIGNVWNNVASESTVLVRGNRIRGHECIHMRPSALSTALYNLAVIDNFIEFVYSSSMDGTPFAVNVTTINELVASGNRIKAISSGPNMAGIYFNADSVPNIAIIGNSISGFTYDFRIGGTLTQAQQAKFQYNLYDTSLGL